jgi:hypothetical protein
MKRPPLKHGDVLPSQILRDHYGMNAANRPLIKVEVDEVPESLRDLVPLVERWAIPCDVTRADYFDHQPEQDVANFWYSVLPRVASIDEWIASQPQDVHDWAAAAVHFMYLLKAHAEAWQPTEDEKKDLETRQAMWDRDRARKAAVSRGQEAFKQHDYATVIQALEPFAKELDTVTSGKLSYARKKIMR